MWDLIVSVPDHCLFFYFTKPLLHIPVHYKKVPYFPTDGTILKFD